MYAGPFGYDGAAPPILDRTADDTPSPLLPADGFQCSKFLKIAFISRKNFFLQGLFFFLRERNFSSTCVHACLGQRKLII